jgi:hypothetical protein
MNLIRTLFLKRITLNAEFSLGILHSSSALFFGNRLSSFLGKLFFGKAASAGHRAPHLL